jgi:acid phosphatase type 7
MFRMLLLFGVLFTLPAAAQEWWFWPDYTLGQKAQNYPGNRITAPLSRVSDLRLETVPLIFHGEEPTERIEDFLDRSKLPQDDFTVELWLVNHVNKPVGALVASRNGNTSEEPDWLLGMYEKKIIYSLRTEDGAFADLVTHEVKSRGWKNYWFHIVAAYDGNVMSLYVNGELIHRVTVGKRKSYDRVLHQLEAAAYMKNEPYMDFGSLVKMLRLHDRALGQQEVTKSFEALKNMTIEGKLYPDLFHFNAGPYRWTKRLS